MKRGLAATAAVVLLTVCAALPGQVVARAASPAGHEVNITGSWTLQTNDCFLGQCTYHITIQQTNDRLNGNDPSTGNIFGWIEGTHLKFNVVGVSQEDDWSVNGFTGPRGRFASGTFADGLGGSGTFTMNKTGP